MLSHERLKSLVEYDPQTGIFTRKAASQKGLIGATAGWIYNGYLYLRVDKTIYKGHRLAWFYVYGEWPPGDIDHINGNRADNRVDNLRVVDDAINSKNQRLYKNNKSGVPGVKLKKATGVWEVYLGSSPRIYAGGSRDWFEAVCIRKSAELRHNYHPNHGRQA
jgi:hypothetical protein